MPTADYETFTIIMQFRFCKLFWRLVKIKAFLKSLLSQVTIWSRNESFDFLRKSIERITKYRAFTEFMRNPSIEFLHFTNFREMIRYCLNYLKTLCLSHFSDTLTWVLFNKCLQIFVFNCGWTSSIILIFKIRIPTLKLLKPEPCWLITSGYFLPCYEDISACLESIIISFHPCKIKIKIRIK